MLCFIRIDTGMEQIETLPEFPDISVARHAAIEKGRNRLLQHFRESRSVLPEFFVEIGNVAGELLAMLSRRTIVFGEAITDPHRDLLCEAIPLNWVRLNGDLAIEGANQRHLRATLTDRDRIVRRDLFSAFPDNPSDPQTDGVKNLSASLHEVLHTHRPHRMALKVVTDRGHRCRYQGWAGVLSGAVA